MKIRIVRPLRKTLVEVGYSVTQTIPAGDYMADMTGLGKACVYYGGHFYCLSPNEYEQIEKPENKK
jgi:hypothetical protein